MKRFLPLSVIAVSALLFGLPSQATATYVVLGDSGWAMAARSQQAAGYISSPYIYPQINEDEVVIGIDKTFLSEPQDGYFQPLIVEFLKISDDAVSKIIIQDEYIKNNTGTDWSDYHMFLVVNPSDPQAGFDPEAVPDGDQLERVSYSREEGYNSLPILLNFADNDGQGVPSSPPGENAFMPGYALGSIEININPDMAVNTSFMLKEVPTAIPEPATLVLLGSAGLWLINRKKRAA